MNDLLNRVFSAPGFDEALEARLEEVVGESDPWAEAAKLIGQQVKMELKAELAKLGSQE